MKPQSAKGGAGLIRIIAGSLKGRGIRVSGHPGLRPTGNKVREAVFDILQARVVIPGCRFLDCCAGTGAVGIEALSRGAAFVEFVEADHALARVLQANLEALGLTARSLLTRGPRPAQDGFDVAFLDPPYALVDPPLAACAAALLPGGALIHESGDRRPMPALPAVFARSYHYGRAHLHLHELPAETPDPGNASPLP